MPADVHLEEGTDGSRTLWMSEHDPLNRLKGMHGIRLRPDSSLVELRARLFNRTPFTQTFLWWANVAAMVHDNYMSFFPPDVHYVADHAVRAMSNFPVANGHYYGVNYGELHNANDLRWYKNIPVPTSYMVCETAFDFFGGYDFDAKGGFIHVANKHIAPGKKQWTWGNHEFGWAWDRELTDANGAYVELMAGVYTDNQPDFTYLLPYETKTFSQYWWPYKNLGPVQNANTAAALRLEIEADGTLDLGAATPKKITNARIILTENGRILLDERVNITPELPWQNRSLKMQGDSPRALELILEDQSGRRLIAYRPVDTADRERSRALATEPPSPQEIETNDELFITAEHLEQYRHPTRYPEPYWEEALRRDPGDIRVNIAYGRKKLYQGELAAAEFFSAAITRLTSRHPNPCTGEAHYYLGLTLRFQGMHDSAYPLFYKATWNYEWRSAAYYELALIDMRRGDLNKVIEHCQASLDTNRQNNKARILQAIALQKQGHDAEARAILEKLLESDPLDHWARYAAGDTSGFLEKSRNDAQTILDIAYEYADAGLYQQAAELLQLHHSHKTDNCPVPNPLAKSQLTHYLSAWLQDAAGNHNAASKILADARKLSADYFFPSRLQDMLILEWATAQKEPDPNADFALGNFLFDRKRHEDAIARWEAAAAAGEDLPTAWRNLGIAYWNVRRDGHAARNAYLTAMQHAPDDARIFTEYDQLRKKLGDDPAARLKTLKSRPDLVDERDDASVELAALHNHLGQPEKALEIVTTRRFHPWEGGEGKVLKEYTTARMKLGQQALQNGQAEQALEHFRLAMRPPQNLGEAYHLLQAKADVNYYTALALKALGRTDEANQLFEASANEAGDFQDMAVTAHSELSYYKGLALIELGRLDKAAAFFDGLREYAEEELRKEAKIDYFATSLPLLLVFEDDLDRLHRERAENLLQLAEKGTARLKAVGNGNLQSGAGRP